MSTAGALLAQRSNRHRAIIPCGSQESTNWRCD